MERNVIRQLWGMKDKQRDSRIKGGASKRAVKHVIALLLFYHKMGEGTHCQWTKRLFVTKVLLFEWTPKPDIMIYIYTYIYIFPLTLFNFPNQFSKQQHFVVRPPGLLRLCFCSENLWSWRRLGKIAGIIVTRADGSTQRKILSPCHLVQHKYQINWFGFEPGTQRWVSWYCERNDMKMDGCYS